MRFYSYIHKGGVIDNKLILIWCIINEVLVKDESVKIFCQKDVNLTNMNGTICRNFNEIII